jgi:hypothetical protein
VDWRPWIGGRNLASFHINAKKTYIYVIGEVREIHGIFRSRFWGEADSECEAEGKEG